MAASNKNRIGRARELLRDGLVPFVEREQKGRLGADWLTRIEDDIETAKQRWQDYKIRKR